MKISEVADAAGVNIQTLRYYERRGLLAEPPRTLSGHRVYDPEAVRIVRFVKSAQELGFPLNEIEDLLSLRGDSVKSRAQVRQLATERLRDVEGRIERLQSMRIALIDLIDQCDCSSGRVACPILESLEPTS